MPDASEHDHEHLAPGDVDFEAVARISSRVELRDVRISSASATRIVSPEDLVDDWGKRVFIGFDSHPGAWSSELSSFVVNAKFIAAFGPGWDPADHAPDPDDPEVAVEVAFELVYDAQPGDEPAERDLEHFAMINGTLHAWPYWRELAHSMTRQMGIQPVVVGVFKVPWSGDPVAKPEAESAE
jgi:hypothetical protein